MSGIKTLFRRLRTIFWTAFTLITLLAAVMVGVGKLLMPYSVRYQPQLEAWLSKEFNQPVQIDSFSGEWKAFGPRISLEGLNLAGQGPDAGVIAIQHAALDIKPLNALMAGRPLYTFRIIGADLALVRTIDGRFEVSGLGFSDRGGGGEGSGLNSLARVGEVRLEQASISYDDDQAAIHIQLVDVNGALQMDGGQLAVEVEASVSDQRRLRVLGDLDATIIVRLDDDQRLAAADWHVKTGELMVSDVGRQLPEHDLKPLSGWLNAELWGAWSPGQAQVMDGVLDVRDASLEDTVGMLQLDHFNARFQWRWNNRKTWRIELADVQVEEGGKSWNTDLISVERNIPGGLGVWVSADYMQVEFPLRVTQRVMSSFNARWPGSVPKAATGQVRDFHIIIDADKQLASFGGRFQDLSITDWGRYPKVSGIDAEARLAFGEGDIRFQGEGVRIDWQRNFRSPAVVDILSCSLEYIWTGRGKDWQIDARDCEARNEFIHFSGRTRVKSNTGKPALDINVEVLHARLDMLDDYWPESIMKPKITNWLRRGLVAGEVGSGRFVLAGDMDDWPFRGGEGTLEARVDVAGAELDYYPGWPSAKGVEATAVFKGVGMEVSGSIADIGGAPARSVSASIGDFQNPILDVEYESRTELPNLVDFIGETPLLTGSQLDLGQFIFSAPATAHGRLQVPLKTGAGALQVAGTLDLEGNGFQMPEADQQIDAITGLLTYDQDGFLAEGLQASYHGQPTAMKIQADWNAARVFGAQMTGRYPVALILGQAALGDDPLLGHVSGDSDWEIELSVTASPGAVSHEIWLRMESTLEGVSMDLPPPLDKAPERSWPIVIRYPIQSLSHLLTVELEGRLAIEVETQEGLSGPIRAAVQLGGGPVSMPPPGLFRVAGSAAVFDLDQWMDLIIEYIEADRRPGDLEFSDAGLKAGKLLLMDRSFSDVGLEVQYADDVLSAVFDGELIAGTVRYSRAGQGVHTLTAELERLALSSPEDEGMTMDTNPADLPEMHLYVREFRYLDMDFGETRIEAYPLGNGLRIESVEAVSPQMTFQARGDWIVGEGSARSDFDIVVTSESLGSLVEAMNLSSVLEGGQTMVHYDAWWPGPPAAFALSVLNGEMQFSIIDGRILNADPGAGRVLGLISVSALPRRLALDFRDVFESGFGFDQASGTVLLENGTAHTDDFVMESTAANLSISGSSNLVEQRFDYEMTVRPGVSQALPVIGAIAAGPGGAAAGLALEGLLRQALGDATEARYAISGPWSDPEVVRLDQVIQATPEAENVPAESMDAALPEDGPTVAANQEEEANMEEQRKESPPDD